MKAKYEEKFVVINIKKLDKLSEQEKNVLCDLVQKIDCNNKYYVCNQDEPYAQKVIDIILEGEGKKA
jgi:hypothetical protein